MKTSKPFTSYKTVVDYLFEQLPMFQRQGPKAFKKDLNNIILLCDLIGNPQDNIKSIHIAGTNGKGSVAHFMGAVSSVTHKRVGLYTSPHLKDYRERIKINGTYITEQGVIDFVNIFRQAIEEIKPSFFEITVAMAFWWFDKEGVDIAIIETGLGGRLDSTNIIRPELSVITNIGHDHMMFLGSTLPLIAGEKAGIIKEAVPVVIGESHPETEDVFNKKASELSAPITFADQSLEVKYLGLKASGYFRYQVEIDDVVHDFECDLGGAYQSHNLCTAIASAQVLFGINFKNNVEKYLSTLQDVASKLKFFGRWQILKKQPLTIADGGHNREGLVAVIHQIESLKPNRIHAVLAFVMEKDPVETLSMWPQNTLFYLTKADIPRAMSLDKLEEAAQSVNVIHEVYKNPVAALEAASREALDDDLIFVGGSLYLIAEVI